MATVNEILNKILVYLGRPTEESLGLSDILVVLYGRIDYYRTMLGTANRNWLVGRTVLTVDSSTDEYNISAMAGDFARPILVETHDTTQQNFEKRPVDITGIQTSSLIYPHIVNPSNFSISTYYKHNARAFAFWGFETSDIKCRVIPQPIQVAEYQIWYEPGKVFDPDLVDSPQLMPEFHDMLAVHSAWLLLPNCRWYNQKDYPGNDPLELEQMNNQKRSQTAQYLVPELQRLEGLFEKYRRSNKHERPTRRQAFNNYRQRGMGRRY